MNPRIDKKKGYLRERVDKIFGIIGHGINSVSRALSNRLVGGVILFNEIKEKSKDIINTNLELAEFHLQNNNLLDAKIRYKIILKMDRNNFYALAGLGLIYLLKNNLVKAIVYFRSSLEYYPDEETRLELEEIIYEIETKEYEK